MKLLRFDLLAFGPFSDVSLDLSAGEHGLHIIYGLNEAGKSTMLRGVYALLFGIPERTTDNFVHTNRDLRLGGLVRHSDGSELEFLRCKARRDALLDSDGLPLEGTDLGRFLGGVGADLFETMFGFDHDRLVEGSEAILQGSGEVGESLFSAGLGGADVGGLISALETEAGELFKPRGRSQTINLAISEYKEIGQNLRKGALSVREWTSHDKALSTAQKRREEVATDLTRLTAERDRIERILGAMPNLVRRDDLNDKLEQLGKVRLLADDFSDRRRDAGSALEEGRRIIARSSANLERFRNDARKLCVPEAVIDRSDGITDLFQTLGSHRKAAEDRSKLIGQVEQLQGEAEVLLAKLRPGRTLKDIEELRPSALQSKRIQDLAANYQPLKDTLGKAKKRCGELGLKHKKTVAELEKVGPLKDGAALARVVRRAQQLGDTEGALNKTRSAVDMGLARIETELDRLGQHEISIADIERAAFPLVETIDRFEKELSELESEEIRISGRITEVRSDEEKLSRKLDELRSSGEIPSEEALTEIRQLRDQTWQQIREDWLNDEGGALGPASSPDPTSLAGEFEGNIQAADQVSDRLRREADRVATMVGLTKRIAGAENALRQLESDHAEIKAGIKRWTTEWQAAWSPCGIVPTSPREMRAWNALKDSLVKRLEEQGKLEVEALSQEAQIESCREALAIALKDLGVTPTGGESNSLADLIERCSEVVEKISETRQSRETLGNRLAEIDDEVKQSEQEHATATSDLGEWEARWNDAIKVIGVSEDSSPSEGIVVLEGLGNLFDKLDEATKLTIRVEGIDRDAVAFEAEAHALANVVDSEFAGKRADEVVAELYTSLTRANRDAATLETLQEQNRAEEGALAEAQENERHMTQQLMELCAEAGVAEVGDLPEAERGSNELKETKNAIDGIEQQLIEQSGIAIKQLETEADGADPSELKSQSAELERRLSEIEEERSNVDQEIGSERQSLAAMDGSDSAAEAAERAQSKLAEIRSHAQRYVRLRLASSLLKREVERYRAENQAPLLARASELFSGLTLGSFGGLESDFDDKDEPVLVGVRDSGERVRVAGMSTGTRDQLYLALRLASLEKYIASSEPMPFIVDDILTSFDDKRAAAALRVLADLSKKTQVLFFTHHRRLVELAGDICGDAAIVHNLGRLSEA